jgi:hypothetical protein
MTWKQHRILSIAWFIAAIVGTSVFYIVLLRQFGALPAVRENAAEIHSLRSSVDSLRVEVRGHVEP